VTKMEAKKLTNVAFCQGPTAATPPKAERINLSLTGECEQSGTRRTPATTTTTTTTTTSCGQRAPFVTTTLLCWVTTGSLAPRR
jgi:hypothetical protein